MTFSHNKITPKIIWIIDIWTYKIRVWICKFQNRELELIWYWEKRQDFKNIDAIQDFTNIKLICENISLAIKKAENNCNDSIKKDEKIVVKNIILNIPFEEIFLESNSVNYIRKTSDDNIYENLKLIDKKELLNIFKYIEDISIRKNYKKINELSWYNPEDIRLIIWWITKILIDKEKTINLLNTSPKEINISILNIFIPESRYEIIKSIGRSINKNIVKIIPSEFAIMQLFDTKKDIVIIDLWSYYTSIIVKKNDQILWIRKISIWINSLIKEIKKNYKKTNIDIINSIDKDLYLEEKEKFLKIFKNILMITLEDLLGKFICPNDFFMTGWWSNDFIKKYLNNIDLNKNNLKIVNNINFINPKIEYQEGSNTSEISIETNYSKSNLNIYAMMMSALDFIKKEHDPIEKCLKEVISEIK